MQKQQQRASTTPIPSPLSYATVLGKCTASAVDSIVSELVAGENAFAVTAVKSELVKPLSRSLLQIFATQTSNPIISDYANAVLNERAQAAAVAAAPPTRAAALEAAAYLPVPAARQTSSFQIFASAPKREREEKHATATAVAAQKIQEVERVQTVRAKIGDGVATIAKKHAAKGRAPSVAGTGVTSSGGLLDIAAGLFGLN